MRMLALATSLLAACGAPQSQPSPQPIANRPDAGAGDAGAIETIVDTDEEHTALSARKWKYAAFFNRLKRAIAQNWDPERVWKALPANDRAAYGTATRTTTLVIAVEPDGALRQATLKTSSGVLALDDEALRAVTAAAPFGAPPSELAPFSFSFFFEVGTGSKNTSTP
jgi:TonB family protein